LAPGAVLARYPKEGLPDLTISDTPPRANIGNPDALSPKRLLLFSLWW
jgi:hypothetical protein